MASKEHFSEETRTICKICGKTFEHLGSHIYHKHGFKANDYKEKFGLPYCLSLISSTVEAKKKKRFEERREYYLKNLKKGGTKHRFKKGHFENKTKYIAKATKKNNTARIQKVNKNRIWENCPVCNMQFKNLDSHLGQKHNLKRI